MLRILVAFLRREREEIAAVPKLFTPWQWPGEAWLLAVPLAVFPSRASFSAAAIALIVGILLVKAKAGRGARLWSIAVFFFLPMFTGAGYELPKKPIRAEDPGVGAAEVRDACLGAGSTQKCRAAVLRRPNGVEALGAGEQLKAWKIFSRRLRLEDYPPAQRNAFERQIELALWNFQRRDYFSVSRELGELRKSFDLLPETEFVYQASVLAVRVQGDLSRREPASSAGVAGLVAKLERDGEALRWNAANDRNARERLLHLAVTLRSYDRTNEKALGWMRDLGVRP